MPLYELPHSLSEDVFDRCNHHDYGANLWPNTPDPVGQTALDRAKWAAKEAAFQNRKEKISMKMITGILIENANRAKARLQEAGFEPTAVFIEASVGLYPEGPFPRYRLSITHEDLESISKSKYGCIAAEGQTMSEMWTKFLSDCMPAIVQIVATRKKEAESDAI